MIGLTTFGKQRGIRDYHYQLVQFSSSMFLCRGVKEAGAADDKTAVIF